MRSNPPLVSVILLSYNRSNYFREALRSVSEQSHPRCEIIVVDNRSPASEEIAAIVREYPMVRLIANAANVGFTGGMNQGIAAAMGRYIYLTEDDIVLDRECLSTLVEHLESHPEVGLASGLMLNKESGTVRCAGGEARIEPVFRLKILGADEPDKGQYQEPYDVNYVPGAMMFAPTRLLQGLGGFRDDFFMYCEDLELCARVLKAGYRVRMVPRARVLHFEPSPGSTSTEIEFHKRKNFYATYLLHAPYSVLPEFILRYGVVDLARALRRDPRQFRLQLRAFGWVASHFVGLMRDRWSGVPARSVPPAGAPVGSSHPAERA